MLINKIVNSFKNNRGFTLIELLVSLSILSVVSTGLAYSVNTIFINSQVAVDETVSLRQVQNAGFWITRDIQRAKASTISTEVENRFLDMDYYTGNSSTSTGHVYYEINDGVMTRYLSDGTTMPVAQDVVGEGSLTTISGSGGEWTFHIAVSNGDTDIRTGVYVSKPRVQ